jgi:hypothetical protein
MRCKSLSKPTYQCLERVEQRALLCAWLASAQVAEKYDLYSDKATGVGADCLARVLKRFLIVGRHSSLDNIFTRPGTSSVTDEAINKEKEMREKSIMHTTQQP